MKSAPVAWHGLPGSAFAYTAPLRAHTPLEVKVSIPHNRVQTAYACHIWEASLLLADAISSGELDVKGERVLELGAGAGLAGLVARRKGAEMVSERWREGDRVEVQALTWLTGTVRLC